MEIAGVRIRETGAKCRLIWKKFCDRLHGKCQRVRGGKLHYLVNELRMPSAMGSWHHSGQGGEAAHAQAAGGVSAMLRGHGSRRATVTTQNTNTQSIA